MNNPRLVSKALATVLLSLHGVCCSLLRAVIKGAPISCLKSSSELIRFMYGLFVNSLRSDTMSFGGVKDVPIRVLFIYSGGRSPRVAHVLSNLII